MKNRQGQLNQSIDILYTQVIKLTKTQSIVIIGSGTKKSTQVSDAFYRRALNITKQASVVYQDPRTEEEYMEESVRMAMVAEPDVVILTDVLHLGRDAYGEKNGYFVGKKRLDYIFYYLKAAKKSRVFWFYVESISRFIRTINVDYKEMGRVSRALVREMAKAQQAHIVSAQGTDLWIDLSDKKRKGQADYDGQQHLAGTGVNIPMGEVLISPTPGGSHGKAVVDGSYYHVYLGKTIVPTKPFTITFANGQVKHISKTCKEAIAVEEMIRKGEQKAMQLEKQGILKKGIGEQYKHNARNIGEFAIGVNPSARYVGDLLEDEKVYGTAHFAIGSSYDGERAMIHSDLLMLHPKITFHYKGGKEKVIVNNGKVFL